MIWHPYQCNPISLCVNLWIICSPKSVWTHKWMTSDPAELPDYLVGYRFFPKYLESLNLRPVTSTSTSASIVDRSVNHTNAFSFNCYHLNLHSELIAWFYVCCLVNSGGTNCCSNFHTGMPVYLLLLLLLAQIVAASLVKEVTMALMIVWYDQ